MLVIKMSLSFPWKCVVSQTAKAIRFLVCLLSRMPIDASSSAWRTKPCKFFAEWGRCSKGSDCRFSHLDAEGNDLHEYPEVNDEDQAKYELQRLKAFQEESEEFDFEEVGEKEELAV